MSKDYELSIINNGKIYFPNVVDTISWEDEMKGTPSKLSFQVINNAGLVFEEGNAIRLKNKGKNVFFGYIFSKKRDKKQIIDVIAYDQMRYLKNKDTIVFQNKTATEVLKQIGRINQIKLGTIDNTGLKMKSFVQDDKSYFDMIYDALDIVLTERKKMYILYDNFGKLSLRNIENLEVKDLIVTDSNVEDFTYESSIDEETYNQIKLAYDNEETGKREIYIARDSNNINKWGLLQYFESIDEKVNGKQKVDVLLELFNRKTRKLKLKNVKGNINARGGFRIGVVLKLGDISLKNYLVIESVKHTFKESEHTMDLNLIGGEFIA